jgi:DNA-binding MarR family transcriptional regulator
MVKALLPEVLVGDQRSGFEIKFDKKEFMMSQPHQWYMDVSQKVVQGIGAHTNPKIQEYLEDIEGLDGQDIAFVQIGYAFIPKPLIPESFIERGPYTNPKRFREQMDASVERGWLESVKDGGYKLSEKGNRLAESFFALGNEWFGSLPALSEEDTTRIAELLAKLVKKAHKLPEPARKPTLEIGIRLNPGPDAAPMLRVRRHLTDLAYYRDDVHIAAWKPYGVDGKVWETLTYTWREETSTAAEMAEQLSEYRDYNEADYAAAFKELVTLGWVTAENDKYLITEKGKKLRQEAEDATDQYFYAPFDALTKEEIKEFKTLLENLAEVVKPPETEEESA